MQAIFGLVIDHALRAVDHRIRDLDVVVSGQAVHINGVFFRHRHPALVGDPEAAAFKRSLVERIAATKDRGTRLALYREMHAALERVREARAGEIETFQRNAADRARRAAEQGVIAERTWALPLYPDATLTEIAQAVREAVRKEMGP